MITKSTEDIRKYVVVNSKYNYDNLLPYLKRALKDYLYKYISKEEYAALESYNGADQVILEAKELTSECEVNLAMYYFMNVAGIQITSGGVHVTSPEGQQSAPKQDLRDALRLYKKTGLSALDNLLELLEEHEDKFPAWKASKQYTKQKDLLVNTTSEFQQAYDIFNSVQTFLSLVPELSRAEKKYITPAIGSGVLKTLKETPTGLTSEQEAIYNEVKRNVQDAIVLFAVHNTIGSGMYLQEANGFQKRFDVLDYERNFTSSKTINNYLSGHTETLYNDATQYLKTAEKLIKENTNVFTSYVPKETKKTQRFIAGKGIIGV